MALVGLYEISLSFGSTLIFDELSLELEDGQRVALLGRNGAGKTTMMKVIAGEAEVDKGKVVYQKGVKVALLPQEVPTGMKGSVFDIVLSGLGGEVKLLADYHQIARRLETEQSSELMRQLGILQAQIDHMGGWDLNSRVEYVISRMKLDPESDFDELSGGQKRRALLARALVIQPDILLLDEPTNHLDIDSIEWLEGFLREYPGTVFFVTHDRAFMTRLANRIVELDRGKIYSWECDYRTFLERKKALEENEAAQWANFDKKLAKEEIWIRQGVKARRCREEGRVKALERLREEKKNQRKALGLVQMKLQETGMSGHIVIKAVKLNFSYGGKTVIRDFSTKIMRQDKIGLIGPNGSGKTTLIKILLGELVPLSGKVRQGTNLEIAYYDQLREQLDEEKTIAENISSVNDTVMFNGKPRHIIGYLQGFLFSPERIRTQVKLLSGGERNRLLLAKLFSKPSNFLVMDEPTNDLDIETLELLEEVLLDYPGTLILVSHDRTFLNNVVTSTMVIEKNGEINEYPGGYDDWLNLRPVPVTEIKSKVTAEKKNTKSVKKESHRKMTFNEKKELTEIASKIEHLEEEQKRVFAKLADGSFYQKFPEEVAKTKARAAELEKEILAACDRWEYLEKLSDLS